MTYKGHIIKGQKLDILVEREVVLELKAVAKVKLPDVATAQALSYLKSTGLKLALLINFSQSRLVDGTNAFLCDLCALCGKTE